MEATHPDIIICTESWLTRGIASGEIFSYTWCHNSSASSNVTEKHQGSGVFIAVSIDFVCSRERSLETD